MDNLVLERGMADDEDVLDTDALDVPPGETRVTEPNRVFCVILARFGVIGARSCMIQNIQVQNFSAPKHENIFSFTMVKIF